MDNFFKCLSVWKLRTKWIVMNNLWTEEEIKMENIAIELNYVEKSKYQNLGTSRGNDVKEI